jgi:hypothetical protein
MVQPLDEHGRVSVNNFATYVAKGSPYAKFNGDARRVQPADGDDPYPYSVRLSGELGRNAARTIFQNAAVIIEEVAAGRNSAQA